MKFIKAILFIPRDFLRLIQILLHACWMSVKRWQNPESRPCQLCGRSELTGGGPRPCYGARDFRNVWMTRLYCHHVRRSDGAEHKTPMCVRGKAKIPSFRWALSLLLVFALMAVGGAGAVAYKAGWRPPKLPAQLARKQESERKHAAKSLAKALELEAEGKLDQARIALLHARQLNPEKAEIHQALGRIYRETDMMEAAFSSFNKAYELAGNQGPLAADLMGLHLLRARPLDAWVLGESLGDPSNQTFRTEVQLLRARAAFDLRQWDKAESMLKGWTPSEASTLSSNAGRLLLQLHQPEQAAAIYDQALVAHADDPALLAGRAAASRMQGALEEGAAFLQQAVQADPEHADVLAEQGEWAVGQQQLIQAIEWYARAGKATPSRPEYRVRLGEILLGMRRFEEARAIGMDLLKDPVLRSRRFGVLLLARLSMQQGIAGDAVSLLGQYLEKRPNDVQIRTVLAEALFARQNYKQVKEETARVLEISPRDDSCILLHGRSLFALGEVDAAKDWYLEATQHTSDPSVYFNDLASQFYDRGQYRLAAEYYESVLKTQPDNRVAINNLALILADEDRELDRAYAMIRRLAEEYPGHPTVTDTHGWVLFKQGKTEEALKLLDFADRMGQSNAYTKYHLGVVYLNRDKARAQEYLEASLRFPGMFPGRKEAARLLAELAIEP